MTHAINAALMLIFIVLATGLARSEPDRHFDRVTENLICDKARAMTPEQRAQAVITMRISSSEQLRIRRKCGI